MMWEMYFSPFILYVDNAEGVQRLEGFAKRLYRWGFLKAQARTKIFEELTKVYWTNGLQMGALLWFIYDIHMVL